ncbi:MAG: hypothetical protein JO236_05230 [Mycobacterium sp.]|uniref:hypothetical protein n=1 Tax=Mycobacterium sp. TaxID=1785 RepID=UPI001EC2AD0E|nr:hypothetical protein [Mycobacterium sp.]MBW0016935.1 hypothetical protein [Mycobacterium sp.]
MIGATSELLEEVGVLAHVVGLAPASDLVGQVATVEVEDVGLLCVVDGLVPGLLAA